MENRETPRLSPQSLERICQHLESLVEIPPNHYPRPELEDFVLEQETAFSRQFDFSQMDSSKSGPYEMRFVGYLRENMHNFRNHLAKKQREVQFAEGQWQRFCGLDSTDKLNWLEKIKANANSTNGKPIGIFMPKDILQQIEIMRYNVENGIIKPDFMHYPPRDFKCFNFCLNKLTQGIMSQAQNTSQLKPKPEDQPPRIYNNTNIMINNNYLPPTGVQRPMGFPNPMLTSPSMTGIPYAKPPPPPLKKSLDPPPTLKQVPPLPPGITGTTPAKPKPMPEPYDDSFWERMLNLAENPSLNDAVIASSIKQKKPEKKKSEYQMAALEPALQKKVKKDEGVTAETKKAGQVTGQTVIVINRTSTPNAFAEGFKECLGRFEEVFRKNIINTVEKLRENGIAFAVKKALVENGLCFKVINELKHEYGALKVLIYPNNIAIIDCKSLKELEICFDNLREIQDLLKVVNKWQEFTDYNVKSQKH